MSRASSEPVMLLLLLVLVPVLWAMNFGVNVPGESLRTWCRAATEPGMAAALPPWQVLSTERSACCLGDYLARWGYACPVGPQ